MPERADRTAFWTFGEFSLDESDIVYGVDGSVCSELRDIDRLTKLSVGLGGFVARGATGIADTSNDSFTLPYIRFDGLHPLVKIGHGTHEG